MGKYNYTRDKRKYQESRRQANNVRFSGYRPVPKLKFNDHQIESFENFYGSMAGIVGVLGGSVAMSEYLDAWRNFFPFKDHEYFAFVFLAGVTVGFIGKKVGEEIAQSRLETIRKQPQVLYSSLENYLNSQSRVEL